MYGDLVSSAFAAFFVKFNSICLGGCGYVDCYIIIRHNETIFGTIRYEGYIRTADIYIVTFIWLDYKSNFFTLLCCCWVACSVCPTWSLCGIGDVVNVSRNRFKLYIYICATCDCNCVSVICSIVDRVGAIRIAIPTFYLVA